MEDHISSYFSSQDVIYADYLKSVDLLEYCWLLVIDGLRRIYIAKLLYWLL